MPFPETERVIYNKNPLDKVICQIKFPPILKIDAEIPYQFQDKIRKEFPNYSETRKTQLDIPQEIMRKIPAEILGDFPKIIDRKNHEFTTEDNIWTINLTSIFIAFSCTKYIRWEEFKDKFTLPLRMFLETYSPTNIVRIGLRYLDVIKRSNLNLTDSKWSELLKPHILGLLSSPEIEDRIKAFENKYVLLLSDNSSKVKIITGFIEPIDNNEECFMIDSDFYNDEKMPIEEIWDKLNYLHERSSRLIQWSLTEKLHKAMEPQKV